MIPCGRFVQDAATFGGDHVEMRRSTNKKVLCFRASCDFNLGFANMAQQLFGASSQNQPLVFTILPRQSISVNICEIHRLNRLDSSSFKWSRARIAKRGKPHGPSVEVEPEQLVSQSDGSAAELALKDLFTFFHDGGWILNDLTMDSVEVEAVVCWGWGKSLRLDHLASPVIVPFKPKVCSDDDRSKQAAWSFMDWAVDKHRYGQGFFFKDNAV